MKTHYYTTLLLTLVCFLPGIGLLMCEDQKEVPIEDRDPMNYREGSDGIRRYIGLRAHGDYSKLKLMIRTRKMDFYLNEPIDVKFYVRNDSNSEVHIHNRSGSIRYAAHFWKLFHSNYDDAVKTPKWKEEFQAHKDGRRDKNGWGEPGGGPISRFYRIIKLQPGQEFEFDSCSLNYYYELKESDTYELTCFLTTFIFGQEYETPLQSNTLTFRILDTSQVQPLLKGESQHVPYTNPPPGEEVFKQSKPPKNVFYVCTDTAYIQSQDVSPYDYYRQKAKEAEAVQVEAEKQTE